MSKTLRIFLKDVRHLWPEITLTLGITLAFVVLEPHSWNWYHPERYLNQPQVQNMHSSLLEQLRLAANFLLPVAWWLLIARTVQDESLVGDRQFWVTRPYGWPRVLLAKLLLIAVFLILPLFAAKLWLIHHAELSVRDTLPTVAINTFVTACTLVLLLFTLSTVTSTIVRMFFVVLGGVLYFIVVFYVGGVLWPPRQSFGPDPTPDIIGFIPILTCIAVVLLQYAKRRTALSRIILIAVTVLVTAYVGIQEHTWKASRVYESIESTHSPLTIAFDPKRLAENTPDALDRAFSMLPYEEKQAALKDVDDFVLRSRRVGAASPDEEWQMLTLAEKQAILAKHNDAWLANRNGRIYVPLQLTVAPHHAIVIEAMNTSYQLPDRGKSIEGERLTIDPYRPGTVEESISWEAGDDWKSYKDKPLRIHLTVFYTDYEETNAQTLTLADRMSMPEHGYCRFNSGRVAVNDCVYPLGSPQLTNIGMRFSNQPCGESSLGGYDANYWIGYGTNSSWDIDYDPVQNLNMHSETSEAEHYFDGKEVRPRYLCAGAPVQVTAYRPVHHYSIQLDLPPLTPAQLTAVQSGLLQRGWGSIWK